MMEKDLLRVTEKLERYRYNLAVALLWPLFAVLVIGIFLMFVGIVELFNLNKTLYPIVGILIFVAGFSFGYLYWAKMFRKWSIINKNYKKIESLCALLFGLPFILVYAVVPALFGIGNPVYYSTIWFTALGLGHLLNGIFVEKYFGYLVGRPMLLTGSLILVSSFLTVYLNMVCKNSKAAFFAGLLLTGLTLLIYLAVSVYIVVKAERKIYE